MTVNIKWAKQRRWHLVLIVFFMFVAIRGNPFIYAQGTVSYSSSLYVVPVLQSIDDDLFPNDSVAVSLGKFNTLFYTALATGGRLFQIAPENVESAMHILYLAVRVVLVLILYGIARTLTDDVGLFILLAAWFSFRQGSLLSATNLFGDATMDHGWAAYSLGLVALLFLFRSQYLPF